MQTKAYPQALEDFSKLTDSAENQPEQSAKAYFYKAKALRKMGEDGDAILHYEQVIRLSEDQHLSGSALYEIAKLRIQQRDFYEAHYNLKRATFFGFKLKKLNNYKLFTEGVIFLMKRKTKTAVKLLTQVVEKLEPEEYIYPLVFLYRAYGNFIIEEYDKALKDYIKASSLKKQNLSAFYNQLLC